MPVWLHITVRTLLLQFWSTEVFSGLQGAGGGWKKSKFHYTPITQSSAKHHFVLQWFYIEVFTWESCTDQTEPRSQSQRWLRSGWRTRWRPPRKPCHTADYEWSRSWTSCCRRLCVRQCWWPRRCNHLSLRSVSNSHSSRCCCTLTGLRRLVGGRELWESERKFLIFIYYHYFLCIWRPWSDFFHIKWLCTLGSEPIKTFKRCMFIAMHQCVFVSYQTQNGCQHACCCCSSLLKPPAKQSMTGHSEALQHRRCRWRNRRLRVRAVPSPAQCRNLLRSSQPRRNSLCWSHNPHELWSWLADKGLEEEENWF